MAYKIELKMKHHDYITWKNPTERAEFEKDLKIFRKHRGERSRKEKIGWFIALFVVQLGLVVSLYAPCAYFIVTAAKDRKKEEEKILKEECVNASLRNQSSENCDSDKLEYYDLQNYILGNLYPFLTFFCQGTAFLSSCLWHVTNYRWWNFLGTVTACLCLPVDILIFYTEPLGSFGTMAAMVLGFVPFCVVIADAAFPTKSITILANGKKKTLYRNSWTHDLSISYNQRYNFVARITWKGWRAFSTVALCIPLFKGSKFDELAIGIVIMSLEGMPQMMSLAIGMMHWDSSVDQCGFELFESVVDIPLVLWYLSFYSSPTTKNAVISKLLLNCITIFLVRYSAYIEKYIYAENVGKYIYVDKDEPEVDEDEFVSVATDIKPVTKCGYIYDGSNFVNVCVHHVVYAIGCPFIGMWESFSAMKDAFIRDVK